MFKIKKGKSCALIDKKGAYLVSLTINNRNILKESEDNKPTHGGSAVLIPFANRVKGHEYIFDGEKYSLPANDNMNSIHGLVYNSEFEVVEEGDNFISLKYNLIHIGYPTILDIVVTYELKESSLSTTFSIKNVGEKSAPITVGAHPYFIFNGKYSIITEEPAFLLHYKDKYFPDGSAEFIDLTSIDISQMEMDNTFFGGGKIKIRDMSSEIEIIRRNMPFFVLYNGVYAENKSIAVEPMSGAPDAFNNKIGLKILRKKGIENFNYKIVVRK